jgi:hypothetical protein
MKSLFPKVRLTAARWDVLTILFVCLTGMVCLVYGVIYLYPRVLPMQLQVPTKTLTQTSSVVSAERATQPFPTFPAEWTAVYATRSSRAATLTPTPLGSSSQGVTPTLPPTVTANVLGYATATRPGGTAAATITPSAPGPSPTFVVTGTAAVATGTLTSATATTVPDTPVPPSNPEGYPGDTGSGAGPTSPPPSDGYP